MTSRKASHAGSWYSDSADKLNSELTQWLESAQSDSQVPVKGCRAIIAPHAGYSYSGTTAAYAYSAIDTKPIKRVFILGPSHHAHLDGCALSKFRTYDTPIGHFILDETVIGELLSTGDFEQMSMKVDEAEHSIEMHLPYIRKIFDKQHITIVPILVGSISVEKERRFGRRLAPYLNDESNLFIVSTDFAHWGTRFRYTYYEPPLSSDKSRGYSLDSRSIIDPAQPIHQSIRLVDHDGMNAIAFDSTVSSPSESHQDFTDYLSVTCNTICGRHPVGVLLGALGALEEEDRWKNSKLVWLRYEQSNECVTIRDSSVSYASGVVSRS